MAPIMTEEEAALVMQAAYRGRRARGPPHPKFTSTLVIKFCAVFNLKPAEVDMGTPDPYVRFSVTGAEKKIIFVQTPIAFSSFKPRWNGVQLELTVAPAPCILVELFDKSETGKDTLLGFTCIRLFSKRARVPHLTLTPTADHDMSVDLHVAFEVCRMLKSFLTCLLA